MDNIKERTIHGETESVNRRIYFELEGISAGDLSREFIDSIFVAWIVEVVTTL